MKYKINALLFLVIFALPGCLIDRQTNIIQTKNQAQIAPKFDRLEALEESSGSTSDDSRVLDIPVGFASQAPFAVWDEFHKETCEEASMIMVVNYFSDKPMSAHIMEQGLLDIVRWEEERGYKVDLTVQEVVTILEEYYSVSSELSEDVSIEFIKNQLNQGSLIIVPAAGRELNNPNFSGDGPIYHMLVIRGYDENTQEFITNDPGTKKGEGYRYDYNVLIDAVHDWDHELGKDGMTDTEMAMGEKILVVIPSNSR